MLGGGEDKEEGSVGAGGAVVVLPFGVDSDRGGGARLLRVPVRERKEMGWGCWGCRWAGWPASPRFFFGRR